MGFLKNFTLRLRLIFKKNNKRTDMQFSRVIYRSLLTSAILFFLVGLIFVNALTLALGKYHQKGLVQAQASLLSTDHSSVKTVIKDPLFPDLILSWSVVDQKGNLVAGENFQSSWNSTQTFFLLGESELIISHQSLLASHYWVIVSVNLLFMFIFIAGLYGTHKYVFRHWKVLIQLEAWASRFSRNEKFKFYIKTRDYHLVNTIRDLNIMRLEAQKGGQKVDHFIRSNTFLDKATGLGNRLYFEHRLESLLQQDDEVYGAVLIIQYGVLEAVRERKQSALVSELLQQFSEILTVYLDDTRQSVGARISANDFAILLPFVDEKEVEKVAVNILRQSQKVSLPEEFDTGAAFHIGADMFSSDDSSFQIMAEADMALRAAQLHGPSGWFMYDREQLPQTDVKGSVRWRTTIENAINRNRFVLRFQPVVTHELVVHHHEVLIRLSEDNGSLVSAKIFLPMARKSGLIPEVDKQVLNLMAAQLNKAPKQAVSVNIHIDSWLDRGFGNWLIKFLKRNQSLAKNLIFEISEFELAQHGRKVATVLAAVKRFNARVMVDQVGLYVVDTNYLNYVAVDFLKLHQSIVNQISRRPENQMFIRSLQGVVSSKALAIFAMGVESEQEVHILKRLGIFAMQGHYIKEPDSTLLPSMRLHQFDGDRISH